MKTELDYLAMTSKGLQIPSKICSRIPGPKQTDKGSQIKKNNFSPHNWVADCQPTGVLVTLDASSVAVQFNNLADQLVPAHFHQFVHFSTHHLLSHYQRPCHFVNTPETTLTVRQIFLDQLCFLFFLRFRSHISFNLLFIIYLKIYS